MTKRPFSTWTSAQWARASLLVLFATWLPPMFKSLWVDELGSYWTISGSLSEVFERSTVQGQSPFTYVLMWLWNSVLAPSDFGIRVLPVLFGLGTLAVLFSIGKRIGGSHVGWYAVAAAASMYETRAMFVNFRPYAFGLFFLALATRLLISWDDRPRWSVRAGYVLATAATVWSVYYFGFALIGHLAYVLARRREGSERSMREFSGLVVAAVVLCIPVIPHLSSLAGRSDTLQFSGIPLMRLVVDGFVPIGMAGAWVAVVWACGVPNRWLGKTSDRQLIAWFALAPGLILYLLTVFTDLGLWTFRYRSAYLLGFALAVSIWIGSYTDDKVRRRAVLIVILIGFLVSPPNDFASTQDWRGAIGLVRESVDEDGLVILGSGLIEAASLDLLEDPNVASFVAAPLVRYPVDSDVLLGPFLASEIAYPYLVAQLSGTNYRTIGVVSIDGDSPGYTDFSVWLAPLGYSEVSVELAGRVQVIIYERG